jgi:hypothetical protein
MPPARPVITSMPPAFVPEDILQHLQAVKTNFPHLTLENTIDSTWSAIKADKNLSSKGKKSVIKMAREQLDKQLHAKQLLKRKPDAHFPKARHNKKIKNWMDSDATTKPPKILNRKLNYQHLLKMEQAPIPWYHPNSEKYLTYCHPFPFFSAPSSSPISNFAFPPI